METAKNMSSISQFFFQFQMEYPWFSHLNLQIKNWMDDDPNTINTFSVCLSEGSWRVIGVNLIIQDSYLENFMLFFSGRSANTDKQWKYHNNLTFLNTFYTYSNYAGSQLLFVLKIANAAFINTTIQNVHNIGQIAFLEATSNSTVNFLMSLIIKNTLVCSLIRVSNFSVIIFQNTLIENNNGNSLVSVDNFSSLLIEDSIVRNNFMNFSLFPNSNNGHTTVKRITFVKNLSSSSSNYGGCIAATNNVTVDIFDTTFYENQFQILYAEFNISVNFSNCQFIKNVNIPSLANIYCYGSVVIENCNFINNSGNTSLSIALEITYRTSLTLRDSSFYNNSGLKNGGIAVSHSSADISNVTFGNNHAIIKGSCISLEKEARVKVRNSTFYGQIGIAVSSETGSGLIFENCTFVNNSSPADSLIEIDNSTLTITHCQISGNVMGIEGGFVQSKGSGILVKNSLFKNNNARYGSIFYLAGKSRLQVENSTLHHNSAVIGGCIFLDNSVLNIINSQFYNNKALSSGGAISCSSKISTDISNITLENCSFINHISGVLELGEGTLMANNTIFKNNIITGSGTIIRKAFPGGVTLENCEFSMNNVTGGALWQYYFKDSILRLSNTNFTSCKDCAPCLYFVLNQGANLTMYTWKSNINIENERISTTNSTFLDQSMRYNMINTEGALMHWRELPFASGKLLLVTC